jgi:DNA-binding MarR family transcriptional regulator
MLKNNTMSDNIEFIKELLDHVDAYGKQGNEYDIKAFSIYLKDKTLRGETQDDGKRFNENNFRSYKSYPEVEFSTLLTGLFRFAKHYLKKAFAKTAFRTIDEFGFLATLIKEGSLLKNELIHAHIIEISSGSEIIKRLIKNGLIYEYPDENDRRAKRVDLTEQGKREIMIAFKEMHIVSEIIIGNLNETELYEALAVFNKLTFFHQNIHKQDRNTNLEVVHSKYINQEN